ncbi:hypothetical protein [Rhizobium sp. BK379]|uniref:hypothetical protein n=1 Tax=Rhizobium sp. BK379 TaxID=2587059 RepID=UPI00161B7D57|nr:hypothetical protein [Rhizobium sp. BK379]MBB3446891.1 hypothetical protein [Rhizobium sp. BK379]
MGTIILKQSGSNYFGEFVDNTTFTGGSFDTSLVIGSFDTSLGLTLAFVGVNKAFFDHSDILIQLALGLRNAAVTVLETAGFCRPFLWDGAVSRAEPHGQNGASIRQT